MNNRLKQYITNYQKPTLIYDLKQIKKNMLFLADLGRYSPIKMLFTLKSFPYKEIIDLAYNIMPGFEISNLNEYKLLPKKLKNTILSINDPTGQLNCRIPKALLNNNVCYLNLDLLEQNNFDANINYGVRIAHTSLIDTANSYVPISRFGMPINQLNQFKKYFSNKKITGLHLHNGSEKNTKEDYLAMTDQILYFLKKENIKISFLNLGGGLHLLTNKELEQLTAELTLLFTTHNIKGFFEPGRCITNNAGYALGKICSIKKMANNTYQLLVDLSSECHLKWSEPVLITNKEKITSLASVNIQKTADLEKKLTISIGGPTCFEHDCLGVFNLNSITKKCPFAVNEILVFDNINGYSAAWNTKFNGIDQAAVLFI